MSCASMIGLIFLAEPIICTLFQHGEFTPEDTTHTAKALIAFAIGIPAYMMTKALSPFFYARGDTTTPVKIAIVGVTLNAIFALILMQFLGYIGIALATGITTWINAGQYWIRLKHNKEFSLDNLFKFRFIRIVVACFVMALLLLIGRMELPLTSNSKIGQIVSLGIVIVIATIAFFTTLFITKAFSVAQILAFLKRKKRRT